MSRAQPASLQASDLLKVREIREVQLSPSGRNVAHTVRRAESPNDGSASTSRTQLYVGPSYGREQARQLTRSEQSARQPAWHPDGNRLAFVRPVEGTPQIFVLSLSGGEAYQLTDRPHGATDPQWGPSGNRLLFAGPVPERALHRRSGRVPPSERPGRSPQDTVRRVPPDTLLVLRHEQTLDPVDTLALGPEGLRRPQDTTRALRTPGGPAVPERFRTLTVDSLRGLTADSLRAVFAQLRLRPDTTTVPVAPDTAASPAGDLLQLRRWLDQRPPSEAQVFTRPQPQTAAGPTPVPTYRHYFLVDVPPSVTTGTPPRPSARRITRGYRSYEGGVWLPGGSQIVVSAPPRTAAHPDRVRARSLYVVDLNPYRVQRLLRIEGYALSHPRVTTDGTTLAFRAESLAAPTYDHAEIGLFELDGRSAPQLITAGFDHDIDEYRWSPDGWYLYATAPSQGGRPLYRFAPFARGDTSAAQRRTSLRDDYSTSRDTFALDSTMVRDVPTEQLLTADRVVQGFDVTDSNALYAALGPQNPSELYANTISFNREQRLSSHNAWTASRTFAEGERVAAWNGSLRVHGRLTRPLAGGGGSPAPLAVLPRGGPAALEAADPVSRWAERQYLAGRGYAVLEVWPRGSLGYGEAYRRANFQDWGPGPASDVLTLADTVAARSGIDGTAQVLAGRAYGGGLVAWLLGHSTSRFRAAVAQNGVYDLAALFGGSPAGPALVDQFGGPPWASMPPSGSPRLRPTPLLSAGLLPPPDSAHAPQDALRRSAPLTTAHRIETPLLLLHGARNHTVPAAQSAALYRRLKSLDRPAEYVRYPGVGHRFSGASPTQRVDRLLRLHEFFARYVDPARQPQSASDR